MHQDDPTIISGSWDPDAGEGAIWIRADFFAHDRIVQLDALQDWIADLTNTYDQLLSHPGSAVGVWEAARHTGLPCAGEAPCCADPDTGGDDDGTAA